MKTISVSINILDNGDVTWAGDLDLPISAEAAVILAKEIRSLMSDAPSVKPNSIYFSFCFDCLPLSEMR